MQSSGFITAGEDGGQRIYVSPFLGGVWFAHFKQALL